MRPFAFVAPCRWRTSIWILCTLVGCSGAQQPDFGTLPEVKVPLEPEPEKPEPPTRPEPEPVTEHDLPDPPAIRTRRQVDYVLQFSQGTVSVLETKPLRLDELALTPRRVGRFAFELWVGKELLERVRFDFPLLGARNDDGSLERGLTTTTQVRVPYIDRATQARVIDRKTREVLDVPWPPSSGESSREKSTSTD